MRSMLTVLHLDLMCDRPHKVIGFVRVLRRRFQCCTRQNQRDERMTIVVSRGYLAMNRVTIMCRDLNHPFGFQLHFRMVLLNNQIKVIEMHSNAVFAL